MIVKTLSILRVTLGFAVMSFPAQSQNLHQWGNIGLFHGLPSDQINTITQTGDGIFWFGTENGLARFDGRRVQTVSLDQVSQVFALAVGKDGELFVGTNNGVFVFKGDQFSQISNTEGQQINAISSNDSTYFAAESGIIFEFEGDSARVVLDLSLPISSIVSDGKRTFIGTEGRGLLELQNGEATEFYHSSRPYFINGLTFAGDRTLWLGSRAKSSNSGLFNFSESKKFTELGEQIGTVTSLAFDGKNDLWVGTKDRGVFRFREGKAKAHFTFENTSGGLRSNQVFDVFIDREGVIWFGTDKGVCRYDGLSPLNHSFSDDPNGNFVRALFQTKGGEIYVGTNRGLYVSERENWLANPDFTNKSIYSIGEDVEDRLIIGTSGDNVRSINNFLGKTYTTVFGKGLFENDDLVFPHDSLISAYLYDEKLYLGTVNDGLLVFSGGTVKPLEILKDNAIRAISGTLEHGLWFATENGLFLWQNNVLMPIIENIEFRSLLVEDDKVFAGSLNRGLFEIKFTNDFGWVFSNLNVEQGLQSSGVFAILRVENYLLIGTGKGISKYSPNVSSPNLVPTRIISERVHSVREIADGIRLEFPQNTLTVDVTGISSRTYPENFQYTFLLTDSKGVVILRTLTKDSQISFENLPPDLYSVEICSFNQDLVISRPFRFNFSVAKAPFPWTSTALAVLLFIAVVALVFAIIEQRQVVKKNKEIAAARFDLANEAERERRRIARDLHDQTLADLRQLILKSDKASGETAEFRGEIESVSNEIRRICEDLSPSVLENVGLTAALEFLLRETIENCNFVYSAGFEERLNFSSNVQMQIYRIAQEVLNNIKRHAEATRVEMTISEGEVFQMVVENDGKPFTPNFDNLPKGRGLSNIKSRAELIEAEFGWKIIEGGKTIFTLQK